jgi:hypothetical protein
VVDSEAFYRPISIWEKKNKVIFSLAILEFSILCFFNMIHMPLKKKFSKSRRRFTDFYLILGGL